MNRGNPLQRLCRFGAIVAGLALPVAVASAQPAIELDASGQLLITGTPGDDVVQVEATEAGEILVSASTGNSNRQGLFDGSSVVRILFGGGVGNDSIVNLTAVPMAAAGGAGNDVLRAGDGDSTLTGGPGDDSLVGGSGDDTLDGGDGDDALAAGDGNDLLNGGPGADELSGQGGSDWLIGEAGEDVLSGGAGDDVLSGGAGDDSLDGGDGSDWIAGDDGNDTILGGPGPDSLDGGAGDDYIDAGTGDDVARGGPGDDVILGGTGADILSGDDGADTLFGDLGDDGLEGGAGGDVLLGSSGKDSLSGGTGLDYLSGGDGNDFLHGGRDADTLFGDAGDDRLRGDSSDVALEGGPGKNTVTTDRKEPFGIVINPANMPDSSAADTLLAFDQVAEVASMVSIFWGFPGQEDLESRLAMIPPIHALGMKSFFQIQVQFVGTPTTPKGMPQTYADPGVRALLLDNIRRIMEFKPDYVNLAPEANLLYLFGREEFDLYAGLYREAYALIKQLSPQTQVGVSQHYLIFRGYEQTEVLDILGPRDYVAATTYPIWMMDREHIKSPADLSPKYYSWLRETFPNEHIIFSEVGWPNSNRSTSKMEAEFIRRMPVLLGAAQPDWVAWTMLHGVTLFHVGLLTDQVRDFLLDHEVDPHLVMQRLNDMGLFSLDGVPRPAWFEALRMEFPPPPNLGDSTTRTRVSRRSRTAQAQRAAVARRAATQARR